MWAFVRGIDASVVPVMVDGEGAVTVTVAVGAYAQTRQLAGGDAVLELSSYQAGLVWAGKLAGRVPVRPAGPPVL